MEFEQSQSTIENEIAQYLRHNLVVNLLDGGFFGFALGFASFVTVIPLFVSTMTDSPILIGLIPAIHNMGWQLPQLLTANRVAGLRRYRPMVLFMTVNERLPFLGLAIVAWLLPGLHPSFALVLTFLLLTWQGLGGGFTATAWQAMIGKIIPARQRGTFFGSQSAAGNLLASVGAVLAGIVLENLAAPASFALCFLLASGAMVVSYYFLSSTREPEHPAPLSSATRQAFWSSTFNILRRDINFRSFLLARMLSQVAMIGFAFYIVYIVRNYGISEQLAGIMTAVLLFTQIIANPVLGWIGDHKSHHLVMELGALAAIASAAIAWRAPSIEWFFLVFILSGIANASLWTTTLAMTVEFGTPAERPAYIGLANTLVAPSTILAPLFGGILADLSGYPTAFLASVFGGVATLLILHLLVHDPRHAPSYGTP